MKKLIYNVFLLLLFATCITQVQAADLLQIYREAREHDAQYAAARATFVAAQERIPQGRAGLLPVVNFTGVGQDQYIDTNFGPENLIRNRSITMSATQPLIRIENFIVYEQAKSQVSQADAEFIVSAQDLILRTAQNYFDIMMAKINLDLVETQKKAINEQLEQAKRNFEVGVSTIVDTHEAQARYDLVFSQEIAAENALEIARRTLQGLINRFPHDLQDTSLEKIIADPLLSPEGEMEDWVQVAQENNFSLKIQKIAYELSEQEIRRNKAQHYPTLDLVAQYSRQEGIGGAVTGRGIDLTSKSIGLQLNVPVFAGFSVQSQVREAIANRDKARNELEDISRMTALQVRQQYLNVTNGIAQVKALRQALISSRSQLDSTSLGQEVGVRTEVDVLDAQQQYFSARRDLAQAYYDYLMSRLRLQAETGNLDEEDILEINALL